MQSRRKGLWKTKREKRNDWIINNCCIWSFSLSFEKEDEELNEAKRREMKGEQRVRKKQWVVGRIAGEERERGMDKAVSDRECEKDGKEKKEKRGSTN